jgi:hypothetical protein
MYYGKDVMDIEVARKEDGALVTVDNYEIEITVRPKVKATVEIVRRELSDYLDSVEITSTDEGIVVKPKGFLGKDKFAEIATKVRALGGEYISAGKESRFLISS